MRLAHVFWISLLILFVSSNAFSEESSIPQAVLTIQKRASDLQKAGNLTEAQTQYRQINQNYPGTKYALDSQAEIVRLFLQGKQPMEAKTALGAMWKDYAAVPECAQRLHEVAWDFVRSKDYATALEVYTRLQKQFSNHERLVWFQRSVVQTYLEQGDFEKAQGAIERMKAAYLKHPDFVNQMIETAERCRGKKQYTMSADIYNSLLSSCPDCKEIATVKRLQIQNMLNLDQAEAADAEVEAMFAYYANKPDFAKQAHEMAWRFVEWKQYDTAVKVYNELIEEFPKDERAVWFQRSLFQAHLAMGQRAKADQVLETVMGKFKDHPDYWTQVGIMAQKYRVVAGDHAAGRQLYRHLLEQFPEHEESYRVQAVLAKTYLEEGDVASASEEIDKLLTSYSNPEAVDEALDLLKLCRTKLKDYGVCLEYYQRILKEHPEHEKAIDIERAMAVIYIDMQAPDMAGERVKKLQSIHAGNPKLSSLLNEIGNAYRASGYYGECIRSHKSVLDLNPVPGEKLSAYAGIAKATVHYSDPNRLSDPNAVTAEVERLTDQIITEFKYAERTGFHVFQIGEEFYFRGKQLSKEGKDMESKQAFRDSLSIWEKNKGLGDRQHAGMAAYFAAVTSSYLNDDVSALAYYHEVAANYPDYEKAWHAKYMVAQLVTKMASQGKMDATTAKEIALKSYGDILQNDPNSPVDATVRKALQQITY